jgi:hypothetical protein
MNIIELNRYQFEEIYFRLTDYVNPMWSNISYDECAESALKYIEDNSLLNNISEMNKLDDGYKLIKYLNNLNAFHSIYITPNKKRIFYEGVMPYRFINEIKFPDNFNLSEIDIQFLCKKYNLTTSKVDFDLFKISIGVIAETTEDFQNYVDSLVGDNYNRKTSRYGKYTNTDKFTYHCISKAIHLCGITVKDVLITENAYKNKEINKIIEIIKPTMYPLSPEKAKEIKENFETLINKHKQ